VLVMLSFTVPLGKIDDFVKAFLSLVEKGQIPPSHVKVVGTYNWLDGEGKLIQIIAIEKGYVDEGLKALNKLLFQYRNIEGLKIKMQPVSTLEEGLAMLGITPPQM